MVFKKLRKKIFPTRLYPRHRRKTIDFHNLYVSSENAHAFYALLLVLDHNDYDKKLLPWLLIGLLNSNNVPFSQFPNQYHDAILLLDLDEPSKQALNKILICAIQTLQNVCVKADKKGYDSMVTSSSASHTPSMTSSMAWRCSASPTTMRQQSNVSRVVMGPRRIPCFPTKGRRNH